MEKEKILNVTAIQMSAEIANKEANFNKVKEIAKREGILTGISFSAAV